MNTDSRPKFCREMITRADEHLKMLDEKCRKVKIDPKLTNIVQPYPTKSNAVYGRIQHIVSNNVVWCWANVLDPFKRSRTSAEHVR